MPKERAIKVKDVSDQFGKPAWEYSDGSVRGERGLMLRNLPGTQQITAQTTHEMARIRVERKQQAVLEAGNKLAGLLKPKLTPELAAVIGNDDLSMVRAVTVGRFGAAVDPDSPYGNAAATWLTDNAGLAEAKQAQEQPQAGQLVVPAPMAEAMARLLDRIASAQDNSSYQKHEIVDAEVE